MPSAIVIPCYNEQARLPVEDVRRLAAVPGPRLVLVNDGSSDGTLGILHGLERATDGAVQVLSLPANVGKAEAVRAGLLAAIAGGAVIVGFADADFATPADELRRLLSVTETGTAKVVLGSRMKLLGATIERRLFRHLVGRAFATAASIALAAPVYDTQCGAKCFVVTPTLARALETPFRAGWAFDVELIARLLGDQLQPYALGDIIEVPLRSWRDVGRSKVRWWGAIHAFASLIPIAIGLRRALRRRTGG